MRIYLALALLSIFPSCSFLKNHPVILEDCEKIGEQVAEDVIGDIEQGMGKRDAVGPRH